MPADALLPIRLGESWLAFDAADARDVLGARAWVALPGASPEVPGVIAWHGRAIAVLDIGAATGLVPPLPAAEPRARTIVIQAHGCTLALPADSVREVFHPEESARQPAPPSASRWIAFQAELDGSLLPVLDLSGIVEHLLSSAKAG